MSNTYCESHPRYIAGCLDCQSMQRIYQRGRPLKVQKRSETQRGKDKTRHAAMYAHRRGLVDSIQAAIGCVDCGVVDDPVVYDFDHVRGEKQANVSTILLGNFETLMNEIEKCEVVCANCHRLRTKDRAHV